MLTAEPIDAWRAEHYHLVSRVVPADQLLTEAETVARQILRNSQHAVRSAKETILDMMGRSLDDQLRVEALNGYAAVIEDESAARLEGLYRMTDAGRVGGDR
jgi:enoyl-CoA hydratase/carnithine racemase